jgi:alkanesulfonate monooxygenase SsuD/methylene tetrahydromethanopterin reductase-like flavin-dependent oxidoreductase (luciferase family)
VAIIGGEHRRFRPLVDAYREAGKRAGHAAEKLRVSIHSLGYVAETNEKAGDDFFPGYAKSFTEIGRERGWPPVTRGQFNLAVGPGGALMVGDAETVAAKILRIDEELGGIDRVTFQMSVATMAHEKLMRATELLGKRVKPLVKEGLGKSD